MKEALVAAVVVLAGFGCVFGASADVEFVGMARDDVVEIVAVAGRVNVGSQTPYRKLDGDVISEGGHKKYLFRGGKKIGVLVGAAGDVLRPFDTFVGELADTSWADDAANCWISSTSDERYGRKIHPVAIYRKHLPRGVARIDDWQFRAPVEYHFYILLPGPLKSGASYEISFEGDRLAAQQFTYEPVAMRSEAVHVSHIGFHPNDPAKTAFVSCWTGTGGGLKYGRELAFHIVDDASNAVVHSGRSSSVKSAAEKDEDAYKRNFNLVDVYELDFSGFSRGGRFRVYVEGIGCSHPFSVDKRTWGDAFVSSARGFYHQRSGIELGAPYTEFKRPRCFHPDDGVKVYASTTRLMDSLNGISSTDPSNFRNLVAGKTDELVADAWGGYMDAGDWDRRIQHLISSLYLLDLAEQFPSYFRKLSLNIPESGNDVADIVDEALFNLDCYRRMQTADGGIRGGIESAEHPNMGEASWQESLTIMAYEPGSWSSYYYAGVSARAAGVLRSVGQGRLADVYQSSAVRAMEWSERDYLQRRKQRPNSYTVNGVKIDRMDDDVQVRDMRNYAAAELYRLTGQAKWHEVFLDTTKLNRAGVDLYVWQSHEQSQAAWTYVNTQHDGVDKVVQGYCREAVLKEARDRLKTQSRTGFRWTKNDWAPPNTTLSTSDTVSLVRAHRITGEQEYLRGVVLACQMGLGANPMNLSYTTGVGHKWARNPLHLDSRHTGQECPEGITVFGPVDPTADDAFIKSIIRPHCVPAPGQWPIMEAYWDVFWYPIMCEFTIQRPMAQNAYAWGYLAAVSRQ